MPSMNVRSRYSKHDAELMASRLGFVRDPDLVEQLRIGMEVEHEHDDVLGPDNRFGVAKIAAAHLREDVLYYLPLVALEAFRDRKTLRIKVQQLSLRRALGGGWRISMLVDGVQGPVFGESMDDPDEAAAVVHFLQQHQVLAVVYAWMNMVRSVKG